MQTPLTHVFAAGQKELDKVRSNKSSDTMHGKMDDLENVERALRRAMMSETIHLESMVSFLATTASAAPFVGLFGTVWGIMSSFLSIAQQENIPVDRCARNRRGAGCDSHWSGRGDPCGGYIQRLCQPTTISRRRNGEVRATSSTSSSAIS